MQPRGVKSNFIITVKDGKATLNLKPVEVIPYNLYGQPISSFASANKSDIVADYNVIFDSLKQALDNNND